MYTRMMDYIHQSIVRLFDWLRSNARRAHAVGIGTWRRTTKCCAGLQRRDPAEWSASVRSSRDDDLVLWGWRRV